VDSRVYPMSWWQRMVGIVLLAVGSLFLVVFRWGAASGKREASFLELMFPVVYLLFAGVFTIRAFRNFVCLSETSIELRTLTAKSVLPFDKIKGRRRYVDRSGDEAPDVRHLVLVPNDDRFPRLDIEELYRFDDDFYRWFDALPDLDELDKYRLKTSNFGLV